MAQIVEHAAPFVQRRRDVGRRGVESLVDTIYFAEAIAEQFVTQSLDPHPVGGFSLVAGDAHRLGVPCGRVVLVRVLFVANELGDLGCHIRAAACRDPGHEEFRVEILSRKQRVQAIGIGPLVGAGVGRHLLTIADEDHVGQAVARFETFADTLLDAGRSAAGFGDGNHLDRDTPLAFPLYERRHGGQEFIVADDQHPFRGPGRGFGVVLGRLDIGEDPPVQSGEPAH